MPRSLESTAATAPPIPGRDAEVPVGRPVTPLDRLLTTERRRRFHLLQTGVAMFVMASGLAALAALASDGITDAGAVARVALFAMPGWFVFFGAIRLGLTRHQADPALTLWQILYGVACCAAGYAVAGAARGGVFPLLMVVLMFNFFSPTLRQTVGVIGATVALFGAVMVRMASTRPDVYPPAIEWAHFWVLATMTPMVAVLTWQLQKLRARLRERTAALEASLARNRFLATRDELTGLVNRRHLLELIEREHVRVGRGSAGYCLALIDLDHFKRVNDRHGHAVGDTVLQAFAQVAQERLRGVDVLGRWGGEEFLLLMPDSVLPAACEGLERLRRAWAGQRIAHGELRLAETLSAGVVRHREGEGVARTIERADAALYRAKSEGRNRVVFDT